MVKSCITCKWARRLDTDGRTVATGGTRVCVREIEHEDDPVTGAYIWAWNESKTCAMCRTVGPCNHIGLYWEQVQSIGIQ